MIQVNAEDRIYLISQGGDISLPLCKNDLWGVLDVINDEIVDNIICHNDKADEVGLALKRIYNRKWD